jgi:hypothetical protein
MLISGRAFVVHRRVPELFTLVGKLVGAQTPSQAACTARHSSSRLRTSRATLHASRRCAAPVQRGQTDSGGIGIPAECTCVTAARIPETHSCTRRAAFAARHRAAAGVETHWTRRHFVQSAHQSRASPRSCYLLSVLTDTAVQVLYDPRCPA